MNKSSIKSMAVRGAAAELLGFGGMQAIRLASTLIMTRLLFPEAFGQAATVSVIAVGLTMLSDAGLEQSIVQSERGDEPAFLNTVWSIQAIRGAILWIIASLAAWPVALIYGEKQLGPLLAIAALGLLVGGLSSTSIFTLRRQLQLNRIVVMELFSQFVGLLTMVIWASISPTVWSIAVGTLLTNITKTAWSHLFLNTGYRNRFMWDRSAATQVFHFGKWIFGSSALTFVARQSDRLLIGQLAGMGTLGLYSMAVFLSEAVSAATGRITHGVLFPILSRVKREKPERLREVLYRARLFTDSLGLIPLGALIMLSQSLIDVMYDPRYAAAGWMLQALCIRVAMLIVIEPFQTCLYSLGKTHYIFSQHAARGIWLLAGIPIAWQVSGLNGVIWVAATAEVPVLLLLSVPLLKFRLLRISREILAVLLFLIGMLIGYGCDFLIRPVLERYELVFNFSAGWA